VRYVNRAIQLGHGDKDVLFTSAVVYNDLGETGDALEWLRKAMLAGYSSSVVRDAPDFDNLHNNPQFQQLIKQSPSEAAEQ
jgi:TPR repeat protein